MPNRSVEIEAGDVGSKDLLYGGKECFGSRVGGKVDISLHERDHGFLCLIGPEGNAGCAFRHDGSCGCLDLNV